MAGSPDFSKDELVRRIDESRERLERRVKGVPTAALEVPGEDGWSAKDHLAHLAGWERSLLLLLQRRARHSPLGLTAAEYAAAADENVINARLHASRKGWRLAYVLTDFEAVHEELMALLQRMTEAELCLGYSEYEPGGERDDRPIWGWVEGNTCDHYDEHLAIIDALLPAAP